MVNDGSIENNFEDRLANAREKDAAEKDAAEKDAVEVADKEDVKKDASSKDKKSVFSKIKGFIGGTVEDSVKNLKDLVEKARQSINKKESSKRDKLLAKVATNDLLEAHEKVAKEMDKTKDTGVVTPGPNLDKDTYVDLENPRKPVSRSDAAKEVASTKDALIVTNIVNPAAKAAAKKVKENNEEASSDEKQEQDLVAEKLANAKENVLDNKELKKGGDFKNTVEQNVATSDDQSTNVVAVKKEDKDASLDEGKDSRAA